jgi:hypothetical protein
VCSSRCVKHRCIVGSTQHKSALLGSPTAVFSLMNTAMLTLIRQPPTRRSCDQLDKCSTAKCYCFKEVAASTFRKDLCQACFDEFSTMSPIRYCTARGLRAP